MPQELQSYEPNAAVEADNHRVEQRSNLFVVATLYSADGSDPVRIRNMSRHGALIEGAVLPPPGSEAKLSRGSLEVAAQVMWQADRRAGLRFASCVSVPDWLPNALKNPKQQRIDELVHHSKLGLTPAAAAPASGAQRRGAEAIAADLLQLKASIEQLAEDLAGDSHVTASHPSSLQILDVAAQALAKLSAELNRP